MPDSEAALVERSTRAIPSLRASLNRLALLTNSSTVGARYADSDHFAFMALSFHAKQLEHAWSALLLGTNPDLALIARSMLEGWWQLKWAHDEPQARAEAWRAFSIIYDWRSIQDARAAGLDVAIEREQRTLSRLVSVRERFLSTKAKRAEAEGRPLPSDPFQSTWHGMQTRQLAESVGEIQLYARYYNEFSDRHHWSPAGVGQGIHIEGTVVRYDGRNAPSTARALNVAFHCLYESALLLNDHLSLGFQDRFRALSRRYVADNELIGAGGTPHFDDPAPDAA